MPARPLQSRELERLRLVALEERLADARRVLGHAASLQVPHRYRTEVFALAALAGELHRSVLEEIAR